MSKDLRYGDSAENAVEENSSVFSLIRVHWLNQQNPPVLHWRCRLTCIMAVKRMVAVVVSEALCRLTQLVSLNIHVAATNTVTKTTN